MRVELQIDSKCEDPYAVIHIARLTQPIQAAVDLLEKDDAQHILTGQSDGKIYIIDPDSIEVIRTEGRELVMYNRMNKRFVLGKPLYELKEMLGKAFIRISKSAIINLHRIDHVEASFNGTMNVVMKNGVEEVITRSFRQEFKNRLGV